MSYLPIGATNQPNYTLTSGGCWNTISKRYVDPNVFCAGDVEAMNKKASAEAAAKGASLYEMRSGVCTNKATGKPADQKYCPPSTAQKVLGFLSFLSPGAPAAQQPAMSIGGMPSWLLPVGLVGLGLGAVLILTKPKAQAAPKTNPARRRRRRR